ncbi:MAG: 30S ribosomal protein S17e [Thermoplasmatota archaeon]
MGNIRPTYIKRVAIELVDRFPDRFTTNFEANKELVKELSDIEGKQMRNRITGYVTRLKKRRLVLEGAAAIAAPPVETSAPPS